MRAFITRPARTAMQAGRANTRQWVLEFDSEAARKVEPLMGWTASADTLQQLRLRFDSEEAAIAFCERHEIPYTVVLPRERRIKPKSYADNFRFDRMRGPGSAPIPRP